MQRGFAAATDAHRTATSDGASGACFIPDLAPPAGAPFNAAERLFCPLGFRGTPWPWRCGRLATRNTRGRTQRDRQMVDQSQGPRKGGAGELARDELHSRERAGL
jgi:hypothetical protein